MIRALLLAAVASLFCSCDKKSAPAVKSPPEVEGALMRIGAITVTQADLDLHLKSSHSGRADPATRIKALDELAVRAQFAQAALDAGLDKDPAFRAEAARILATRYRETTLAPWLSGISAPIPEARLREIYTSNLTHYRSGERRHTAVLWLNPGADPERQKRFTEKLTAAREFLFNTPDIKDRPEKGFSILSVDHSEHAPSRYQGGIVDWIERGSGTEPWTKALGEIVFTLEKPGDVSPVITRPEGIFLVRYIAEKPAAQRAFETVSGEIERTERQRLRAKAEDDFTESIKKKYPVEVLTPVPASP